MSALVSPSASGSEALDTIGLSNSCVDQQLDRDDNLCPWAPCRIDTSILTRAPKTGRREASGDVIFHRPFLGR